MSVASLAVLKKAAVTDLNKGNLDKAVERLQKLVRISGTTGDSEEAISTIPLWLLLGEAYKQKGNTQSAIRVFQSVLEIESNVPSRLQLIELYRLMCKFEESVETARSLKEDGNCPVKLKPFFLLNYVYSLVLYAQRLPTDEEKLPLLEELFSLLKTLMKNSGAIMFQKTLAIAFELISKMDPASFSDISARLNLPAFGINNRNNLVEKQIESLTFILNGNLSFSDSWNDLAVCLSEKFAITKDEETFDKAEQFFKKAIMLPASPQKRSHYWFNLGILQSIRLRLAKASHCYIRALQLNDQNARAWYGLSLVYKKANKLQESFHALKKTLELDPDVVDKV